MNFDPMSISGSYIQGHQQQNQGSIRPKKNSSVSPNLGKKIRVGRSEKSFFFFLIFISRNGKSRVFVLYMQGMDTFLA